MALSDRVLPKKDVLSRNLDGETVVVNLDSGLYYGLDEVGTRVWELIAEHGALTAVREALLAEYEADEATVTADLLRLVGELVGEGLVKIAADAPVGGA